MSTNELPPPSIRPRWSYDVRRWVVIGLVVGAALFIYFIRDIIPLLVLAVLVAYLLNPVVTFLSSRLRAPRIAACALVYLVLIAVLIEAGILVVPNFARQVGSVISDFDVSTVQLIELGRKSPVLATWLGGLDADVVAQQLRSEALTVLEQSPRYLAGAASSFLGIVAVLVLSFYLVKDAPRFGQTIHASIPEDYRADFDRIARELDAVWSGFLRGQVVLAIIIGIVTTLALMVLGVRNALLLGALAGVMEVVPTIGPILAMIPSVLIALFEGSANWQLDNTIFALIVILTYFAIQQLENHVVVPNVLGASVNLPPVLILAGALVGASLAGVLGIFLAAPVLATARLFLGYIWGKLLEPLP